MDSPQLSDNGAKLLADVLARRAQDRHSTGTAKHKDRRRDADELRADPPRSPRVETPDDEHEPHRAPEPERAVSKKVVEYTDAPTPDGDGRNWRLFGAIAFAAAVGVCVWLFVVLEPMPADDLAESTDGIETIELVEVEVLDAAPEVAENEVVDVAAEPPESVPLSEEPTSSRVASDVPESEPRALPGDVEVLVYDTASEGEIYSFALRLKSVSTDEELDTDDFVIVVENEDGFAATTFTRFIHGTLPVDSNALATVRAEDTAPGAQFVTVWLDDVLVARLPVEPVEP